MTEEDDIAAFTVWADELPGDDYGLLARFLEAAADDPSCEGEYAVLRDRLVFGPWRDQTRRVNFNDFMATLMPIAALSRDRETGAGPLELWAQAMTACAIRGLDDEAEFGPGDA